MSNRMRLVRLRFIGIYVSLLTALVSIVYLALCSFDLWLRPKMANRKTRKQKILADQRHVLYHLETTTPAQESHPIEKETKAKLPYATPVVHTAHISTSGYAYVATDIRKTALVTGAIFATQIVLFIFLNRI